MSDVVFSIPEDLISAGLKYSQKSLDVLTLHSSLDAFSQTLHDSLPNEHAQYAMDQFWADWSVAILNMATECESIGNLLVKAAVALLQTDLAILQAYHGDQAEQDKITAEINQSNNQLNQFNQQYAQEKQADATVQQRTDQEQKDMTLYQGQNQESVLTVMGSDQQETKNVTFRVDKDGNITEVWSVPHDGPNEAWMGTTGPATESTKAISGVYFNGHWVASGSAEAKAIHNGTDGGTTSKDPESITEGYDYDKGGVGIDLSGYTND